MKAFCLAGLLACTACFVSPSNAQAQHQGPYGCGTFCICKFSRMHFHGPLVNYGPYFNYGYGNAGNCNDRLFDGWQFGSLFNRNNCNGCGHTWRHYARDTWRNIFHRTHPCCPKTACGSCGG